MSELGFVFDPARCIQCHACETACRNFRETPPTVRWRRVYNLWHGEYPRITSSTLSVSCLHCADPACVQACPVDAIAKREEDGVVLVDRSICIGCRKCLKVCPVDAPQFGEDRLMQKCDLCTAGPMAERGGPACVLACPTRALGCARMDADGKRDVETVAAGRFLSR